MELLKLKPAFKDYLWGGEKLKTLYNKDTDTTPLAESWELSTHKDGPSVVVNGEFKGLTLTEVLEKLPQDCLGKNAAKFPYFPILTKLIDAKQCLSIQVHPDDEYGLRVEKEFGKTEVWYVLDCEENSFLYFGVNKDITKEEFRQRINDNTILDVLKKEPVKKGDVAFIKAGTIHAITDGMTILEIQQNSNTTYRVYDFNRVGKDGKLRDLHIDKAIDVSNLNEMTNAITQVQYEDNNGYKVGKIAQCEYFNVDSYVVSSDVCINVNEDSFVAFTFVSGNGKINDLEFGTGDTFFAPSNFGDVKIVGTCQFVTAKV